MRPLLLTFVLLLSILSWPTVVAAEDQELHASVQLILADRSESMKDLPQPDTSQAFVLEQIHIAKLSPSPVKMAVVLYGGDGVTVLADDQGMPTAALDTLREQVLAKWPKPAGGTPLDEAMEQLVRMVKALPAEDRIAVVSFGDGSPSSCRLRPDDFAAVREEIDRRIQAIQKLPYPPRTLQTLVDRFLAELTNPTTKTCEEVYALQVEAEFQACLAHAAALKNRGARFVTVDFAGGLEPLRQIHQAAGGLERDYVDARPANSVIAKLHALGLTKLDGVVAAAPLRVEAEATQFERVTPYSLGPIGEAAVVTMVFQEPIADFDKHVRLNVAAGGTTYTFDAGNSDPHAVLATDAAGRVATATVVLPEISGDGQLSIHFESPGLSLYPPELTIYAHLRLAKGLAAILHPAHVAAEERPPFRAAVGQQLEWVGRLALADQAAPVKLKAIEPVWRNRSGGDEVRVDLEPAAEMPGVFRSTQPTTFPAGTYDLELHLVLPSGARFSVSTPGHLVCQVTDAHVTIELDVSSKSLQCIDFGEFGDGVREGSVNIVVRSADVEYPLPVEFEVLELADAQGNTPAETWIVPTRRRLTLTPGKAHPLSLRLQLPELLQEHLVDGPFTARLACRRLDSAGYLELRPFREQPQALTQVDEVRFTLKRPVLQASAPRGWTNEICKRQGACRLCPRVDVGVPFSRRIVVRATTTSQVSRTITAVLATPFRDEQGNNLRAIQMTLAEGVPPTQEVLPGGRATFVYELDVSDDEDLKSGTALLRLSFPGLTPLDVPVTVTVRERLLGGWMQAALYAAAGLAAALALIALFRRRRYARYAPGKVFALSRGWRLPCLALQGGRQGAPLLAAAGALTMQGQQDRRPRPMPTTLRLEAAKLPLEIAENRAEGDRMAVRLTEILEGPDGDPLVEGEIVEAGRYGARLEKTNRAIRRRVLMAIGCVAIAALLFWGPVLRTAQWLVDNLSL